MNFAKGYEDGFTGKVAESDDADYMRGFKLGSIQGKRVQSGCNVKFAAKFK